MALFVIINTAVCWLIDAMIQHCFNPPAHSWLHTASCHVAVAIDAMCYPRRSDLSLLLSDLSDSALPPLKRQFQLQSTEPNAMTARRHGHGDNSNSDGNRDR